VTKNVFSFEQKAIICVHNSREVGTLL